MKTKQVTICLIPLLLAGCAGLKIHKEYPVLKDLKKQEFRYDNIRRVTNITEFIKALGNNTVIIVDSGKYVFTDSHILGSEEDKSNLDRFDTLSEHYDDTYIHDLDNLVILGTDKSPPVFLQPDDYNHVMKFRNIRNLYMQNLKLGHLYGGYCVGGVILIHNGENVTLDHMELFGSGTEGLSLIDVINFTVSNSLITKSTEQLSTFSNVQNAKIDNCRFIENDPVLRGFAVYKSEVTFKNSLINEKYPFFKNPQQYANDYDVLFVIDDFDFGEWYIDRLEKYPLRQPLPGSEIIFINTVINDELVNCEYRIIEEIDEYEYEIDHYYDNEYEYKEEYYEDYPVEE